MFTTPHRGDQVLLLEEGWGQTLYLARALEAKGYRVTVATANGASTRHRQGAVSWVSIPEVDSARFLPALARLMEDCDFPLVLPLSEAIMNCLWNDAWPWAARMYPATEQWQRQLLSNKHALLEHMAALGIAVPRQRRLTLDSDLGLDEIAKEFGLPLVVKAATGAGGAKVRIVESLRSLAEALTWARDLGGEWVAQEFIVGPTYLVGGVFHEGLSLRLYAGEKLEQHPLRTGPAIRLRSEADHQLVGAGERVFRELRWSGLASADFIRRSDGSYVLLEVNPRPWGSIAGAAAAGVDLFTPFSELLSGRIPFASLAFAANRDCMIFPRYLLSPRYHNLSGVFLAIRDLLGFQGRDWRDPRLAIRHLRRCFSYHARAA
jgi:biotin carboxylase